jgi:pyrroloquinoline quinone biosynthesis protein B
VKVVLLGTAAGGGVPQWNCACRLCAAARLGGPDVLPRTQDCLALSATGDHWYLVNASPDIHTQIVGQPLLAPGPGPRATPVRGALLTDAELDHTIGLLSLREGAGFRVWAPPAVVTALAPMRDIVDHYHEWEWLAVDAAPFEFDGLRCRAFPLHDKPPRYAARHPGPWGVAYRFEDPATGGTLVYAPCLGAWPPGFDEFVTGADCVLLDGTFHAADELTTTVDGDQRTMGHLPVTDSAPMLRRHPTIRWIYTHLNNTNPLLDTTSRERVASDAEVLPDGARLDL